MVACVTLILGLNCRQQDATMTNAVQTKRTKSYFPLRTSVVCYFSTTTGFPFGTHITAELKERKKGWKNSVTDFLIMAW